MLLLIYTDITYLDAHGAQCDGKTNNVLKLQEGTVYVYNLEALTETSVPKSTGPHGESTKLSIKAKVEVNPQAKCATLIRLRNVQVSGPDDKKHGSLSKLEANPLRVSLNGGRLGNRVDVVKDDDYTSLNIKRAVASLLQISVAGSDTTTAQEIDVFGSCPTVYSSSKTGDSTVVRKTRNLNECSYRENIRHEFYTVHGAGNSLLQSTPLLDPTFESEITVKDGVVESAVAREEYLLRPFADKSHGARTKITTKLTLASKAAGTIPDTTNEDRSIIFENPHETVSANIQTVLAALHKLADRNVGEDAARNVAEFVAIIRRASAEDLLSVYGQVKAGAGFSNKNLAKKVFTDALFRSGSGDSVAVAVELLKSHQITGDEAKLWYLSFGFARHVSSAALEKATTLLDDANLPKEAYLGVGALAGKYCREHECANVASLQALVNKLASALGKASPASRQDETKIIGSLKALRNVKYLSDEAADKVANTIQDEKLPTRVRAAALETAASDACKKKLQKASAAVLNNREEDAELRIKAYLVLTECPNASTADRLSEFIESETVNQVGAFITSHLRNLRATAKPERQDARALLQNVKPRRRFPIDIRKFSQNYELSYDIDALGASASLDSNVIFSQKSYLPRSASLNLTTEVFGHAFNIFELNGRAENLERVLERFVGPKSYLKNTKLEDILRDGSTEAENLQKLLWEKYRKLSRSRRASRSEIDQFGNKVHLYPNQLDDNVDIDVSLRLLGNELLWVNLAEKSAITPEEVINKVAEILERGFGSAKDFEQVIQNHAVFLDTEIAYPTASGLAVKVSATGTSVVHIKVAGSADLAALLKNPKNGQAKVEIRPSASIEISGQLTVDGYAVETGVKLAGNLHTETGSEISIKILDGEGIDINVGLPVKDSDILTVNTEVLVSVRERGQPSVNTQLNFQVPRKDYQACFDQLLPVIGLTLCGKVGFPRDSTGVATGAAFYPLNGHSKLSVRLNKEDDSLTNYHFRLQYSLQDPTNRRIQALIETPGSKTPRELSLLLEAKTLPNKEINVKVVTPIYNFHAQALLTDSDTEYTLGANAELEGIFAVKARLGLLVNGATYTPILEYKGPDGQNSEFNVKGTVTVEKAGPAKRTYTFNDVRVATPQGDISVNGPVTKDTNLFKTDLKIGYGKDIIGVKSKFQRQDSNNIKALLEVTPSNFPDFSFGVKYDYQKDAKHVENKLIVTHGPDLTNTNSRFSLYQQVSFDIQSAQQFDIGTKNTITYPLFGVEAKLDGSVNQKGLHYDLKIGYDKNSVASKLDAKINIAKPGDYVITFSASALEHGVVIDAKRDVLSPGKSKFANAITITPGGKYTLDADVTHQLDKSNVDFDLDVTFKREGSPDAYKFDVGAIVNPSKVEVHSKIAIGADQLLDAEFKRQKTEPYAASFKLNIKNAIESNGQYNRAGDKATASILINLIPIARKLKGTANLSATGSKHQGTIELLYDADKDPSKKLVIQTDTEVTSKSINSKNKIQESGREALINFNGEIQGKPGKGGVSGGYDITLPTGLHLVARGRQVLNIVPSNSDGLLFLEIGYSAQKGEGLTKITLDTSASNVDLKRYSFDVKGAASFGCPTGDAYFKQSVKSIPHDGVYQIDIQNSIGGSQLGEYQYNGKLKATVSKTEISYHTTAALGQKYHIDANGKVRPGLEDKTHTLEQSLLVKTPLDNAKEIKVATNIRYVQGNEATPCQLKLGQELSFDSRTYKLAVDGKGTQKDGDVKGSLTLGSEAPFTGGLRWKHNHENDIIRSEVDVNGAQGSQAANLNIKADYTKTLALLKAQVSGSSPLEKAKKFDFNVNYKRVSTVAGNADAKLSLNDDTTELALKYDLTTNHQLVDASAAVNGAKNRFYWKMDRKSDRHVSSESQVLWSANGGGSYDATATVDLESLENFVIVYKVHSEKLNLNKLRIELGNRPSKGGAANKVNLAIQNKEGKIIVGSASYAIKESDAGFSVEGKGTLSYNNENYPLTYKISQERLSKNANNEVGRSATIDIDAGPGVIKQVYKVTDKEFRGESKVCWKGKCNEGTLIYALQNDGFAKSKSELSLKASAALLASYNVEFTNKAQRDGLLGSCESLLKIQDVSYALRTYVKSSDAGVIVTVPTRELALIAQYQLPERSSSSLGGKGDISLYLDHKKNPKDKATLSGDIGLKYGKDSATASINAKFNHPSLQRDLVLKAEASADVSQGSAKALLELDVFSKKSQKIVLTAEAESLVIISKNVIDTGRAVLNGGRNYTVKAGVISKGLVLDLGANAFSYGSPDGVGVGAFAYYVDDKNVKKDAGVLLSGGPNQLAVLLKIPGHTILDGQAKIATDGDTKTLEGELAIAEADPAVIKVSLKGLREVKGSISPKSNPGRYLDGLISISSEKLEVRADRVQDGAREVLASGVLHLDDKNLFKIDYDFKSENIKKSVKYFENLLKDLAERIRAIAESLSKEIDSELQNLSEALKKALPNFKNINQQYEKIFKAIREEIANDKNFKELAAIVKKPLESIIAAVEVQVRIITATLERTVKEVADIQQQLVALYTKVTPEIREASKKLLKVASELGTKLIEAGTRVIDELLKIAREHEKEIKALINSVGASFQDIGRVTLKNLAQLRNELRDLTQLLIEEIKGLAIFDIIRERINELYSFQPPEHFWELFDELKFNLGQVLPLKEQQDLVNSIFDDVKKWITQKKVTVDELIEIGRKIVDAAKATWTQLTTSGLLKDVFDGSENAYGSISNFAVRLPTIVSGALKLPALGNIRFNLLSLLTQLSDLPTPLELYSAYRPNLGYLVHPYVAYGVIFNSHHFLTFDKTSYAFEGSCSYVLAQDFLDGNFSVVANLQKGKVVSITIADKTDIVQLNADNTVTVNGKAGDFPVKAGQISGWRRYSSVNVIAKAGVHVKRYLPEDIYVVFVNKFYHGRTRGLLGTINNEQYDEFTLPNGHIAKDSAEFANAYAVSQCAPVPLHNHPVAHAAECTAFFTSDSPLRNYFPFLNPEPFRQACDGHAAMVPPLQAACQVAAAYVVSLRQEGTVFATVPAECAQCNVNGKKIELGQSEQVQRPSGKADVVIVFEQSAKNEAVFKDLVTPLISTLSADLKKSGLTDIEFALVGYGGPGQKWPQHYGNNGKVTYQGKSDNIKFGDTPKLSPPYDTLLKKIKYVQRFIEVELGQEQIVTAMNEANTYPFRQGAARTIILINTTPCSRSPIFPISLQIPRVLNINRYYKQHGLSFFIVSPLEAIALDNGQHKSVVGFDSDKVYYQNQIEGNSEDRKNLAYPTDLCLEFSQYYGGAAFSSQNLLDAKPEQKKKFVEVVSHRIVTGAVKYTYTDDCVCTLNKGITPVTECTVSSSEAKS